MKNRSDFDLGGKRKATSVLPMGLIILFKGSWRILSGLAKFIINTDP